MSDQARDDVTRLLPASAGGESQAAGDLFKIVYSELRRRAEILLNGLPPGQTFQPTALVHEAFDRFVGKRLGTRFENRKHFFHVASRAMHDILVERARQKDTLKRGGDRTRVPLDEVEIATEASPEDLLDLEEALQVLEREYPDVYQLVVLRFYGGLTMKETAKVMELGLRTAEDDWHFARTWLHQKLRR